MLHHMVCIMVLHHDIGSNRIPNPKPKSETEIQHPNANPSPNPNGRIGHGNVRWSTFVLITPRLSPRRGLYCAKQNEGLCTVL